MFASQHLKIDSVVYEHVSNVVVVDVEMLMLDMHVEHRMPMDRESPFREKQRINEKK
jgi:hypothetical protein